MIGSGLSSPSLFRYDSVSLSAWLLLLLSDGESYGRALFAQLRDRGIPVDRGLGYRTLHTLDDDGAITSRWTHSEHGLRRRCYRLTRKGRRRLAQLATKIKATCQLHDAFVRAHQNAGSRPTGLSRERHEEPDAAHRSPAADAASVRASGPSHPPAQTAPVDLLRAWVLLLVQGRQSYGYALQRTLDEHDVHADTGFFYRVLRTLERDEWLESHWTTSAAGPPRRLYRLTAEGRRNLDKLATIITATRDTHAAFLHAYEEKRPKPRRRPHPDKPPV